MFRDRIQKPLYPRYNSAGILDYLEELILINAKEVGLVPINQENNGYQDVTVPYNQVISFDVPQGAVSATIMVEMKSEDDPTVSRTVFTKSNTKMTGSSIVVRFKENGSIPELNSGFGLGNNDTYELVGVENLKKFLVIGVQQGRKSVLRVQFYKTAQNI